jgi:hypothetical protein
MWVVNPFKFWLCRYLQWPTATAHLMLMNEVMYTGGTAPMEGVFHPKSWLELVVNSGCDHWTRAMWSTQSVLHLYFLVLVELIGAHVSITVFQSDAGQVLDFLLPKSLVKARVCFGKLSFLLFEIYVGMS